MKFWLRSALALALCCIFLLSSLHPAWAISEPSIYAEAAVLINAETGQVLYEKNARKQMAPASLTKILTCLLAMEDSSPDALVTVTSEAVQLMPGAAAIGLSEGEVLTLGELLYAMMLPSANDAAAAVAVHLGGSLTGFAHRMELRCRELGLTGSSFRNPHGLPARGHYATAYDLAQITREALKHPEFLEYAGRDSYVIPASPQHQGYSFVHLNRALRRSSEFYDPRAIAGKTGWTDAAGNCLMTVGEENGLRLIAVVLRDDSDEVGGAAYRDTRALFDYGFSAFRRVSVTLPESGFLYAPEEGGTEVQLSAPRQEFTALLPRDMTGTAGLAPELAREPERVADTGEAFWGEVILRDRKGEERLTAARVPLAGHSLAVQALGPSPEVCLLEPKKQSDWVDVPLTFGVVLLVVAMMEVVYRDSRQEAEEKEAFWAELDRREGDIFAKVKEEEGLL